MTDGEPNRNWAEMNYKDAIMDYHGGRARFLIEAGPEMITRVTKLLVNEPKQKGALYMKKELSTDLTKQERLPASVRV